jgi:hypothetical protein
MELAKCTGIPFLNHVKLENPIIISYLMLFWHEIKGNRPETRPIQTVPGKK